MQELNILPARPDNRKPVAPGRIPGVRLQCRRWFSVFALTTICFGAINSVPAHASVRGVDNAKKSTTTKLKASATSVVKGEKLTLTVTVSPSKATGFAIIYAKVSAGKPYVAIGKVAVKPGGSKISGDVPDVGTILIKAVYGGSSQYALSTSNIVTIISKQ